MNENEINVIKFKSEHDLVKMQLKDKISSIMNTLKSLEYKLENNERINEVDGLQGEGQYIDLYLAKLGVFDKAIERLEK